jgi:hypothetical protein
MNTENEREVTKMFTIALWDLQNGWVEIASVSGCEFAYEAYRKACEFAELVSKDCALVDAETGEVIAQLDEDEG